MHDKIQAIERERPFDEDKKQVDVIMNDQTFLNRITIDPGISFGKPTIRGLRYSVEWLLELLSSGMSNDEILADYEDLQKKIFGLSCYMQHA